MLHVNTVDHGLLQSRYRLTKQRAAVLRVLGDGTHLSAETILERVRSDMPGVSLGTIYRTLDILREIGLVQMFSYGGIAARYEATLEKHHHILCSGCGSLASAATPRSITR
jgi:Fur family peroxide stress response transcriptional regulator